jgi:hypothetical protein
MINYRKLYSDEICKVPDNFDIHHLDFNHENNDIGNLLMLPRKLHQRFHELKNQLPKDLIIPIHIKDITEKGSSGAFYYLNLVSQLLETNIECNQWANYKAFCLGDLPNIHNMYVQED